VSGRWRDSGAPFGSYDESRLAMREGRSLKGYASVYAGEFEGFCNELHQALRRSTPDDRDF